MIIRILLVATLCGCVQFDALCQDEEQIKGVIEKLFRGMYTADSAMVRSTFVENPTMATVFRDKATNEPTLRRDGSLKDFLVAVAKKRDAPLNEEIWNIRMQIDTQFAQALCDYALYVGDKFSHCGVDAFHLFKTNEGWKIFHIADTRRADGCQIPEEILIKHKQ